MKPGTSWSLSEFLKAREGLVGRRARTEDSVTLIVVLGAAALESAKSRSSANFPILVYLMEEKLGNRIGMQGRNLSRVRTTAGIISPGTRKVSRVASPVRNKVRISLARIATLLFLEYPRRRAKHTTVLSQYRR